MTISSNLASGARRALRAAAHHLDPVVMIGDKGLTPAVLHEIDIALTAHALIKVRVASDDRAQRVAFMDEICQKLGCESVQHLGKLLVLWRNKEDGSDVEDFVEDVAVAAPAAIARGPRKKIADDGMRRPTERDPKPRAPREGGYGQSRAGGYGRSGARSSDRGEGYAPRGTGGYARGDDGSGYKPRGTGFGSNNDGGFNRRGPDASAAARAKPASDNRRFRRGGDAPAPDTRPPREGWAPRNRRGEGRNETGGGQGFPRGNTRTDAAGGSFGGTSSRGYGDSRAPRSGRTPDAGAARSRSGSGSGSGDGRWGSRGGSTGGSAGAAAAPKPRARRRLG